MLTLLMLCKGTDKQNGPALSMFDFVQYRKGLKGLEIRL